MSGRYSVAVYHAYRAYGGPEEGGWYYDAGDLSDDHPVKTFETQDEADTCAFGCRAVWGMFRPKVGWLGDETISDRAVEVFEGPPPNAIPEHRPRYS